VIAPEPATRRRPRWFAISCAESSDPEIQAKAKELFEKFDLDERKRLCA
jgi:hypothetical protein